MRSPVIDCLNESSMSSDISSLELVKSSSTHISEESDTSSSSMDSMDESCKRSSLNENEKDSGVDSGEPDLIVPDRELLIKIVNQVESYFSDENLIKDEFMLKHIRRNKEGFISLKLLASLRKVKVLTKNWKVVAHCIKVGSSKLQINESCTKIRRLTPLPSVDGTKHSRTLIAYNFPNGSHTIEEIEKLFSKFGDISLIRVFKPSTEVIIAANLLAIIGNKFDAKKTTFATIEFNNKSDAEKALKNMELNKNNNWRNSIEVIAMKPPVVKPVKCSERYSQKDKKSTENRENSSAETNKCTHYTKSSKKQNLNEISTHCENKYPLLRRQKSKSYSAGDESNQLYKISYDSKLRPTNRITNTNSTHTSKLPANIIRYPLGPDGTKGFNIIQLKNRSHSEP